MGWRRYQQTDFPGDKIFFSVDFLSEKNGNFSFMNPFQFPTLGGGGPTAVQPWAALTAASTQNFITSSDLSVSVWLYSVICNKIFFSVDFLSETKMKIFSLWIQSNFLLWGGGGGDCSPTLSCRFWVNFSHSVSARASQRTFPYGKVQWHRI